MAKKEKEIEVKEVAPVVAQETRPIIIDNTTIVIKE